MSSQLQYRAFCKAIISQSEEPRISGRWAFSRRAWFKMFDDCIRCGNWTIPFDQIDQVIVYHFRRQLVPGTVLTISANGTIYQFAFNPWVQIERHLSMAFETRHFSRGVSIYNTVARIAFLFILVYWLFIQR
jgi:hypothetical protein